MNLRTALFAALAALLISVGAFAVACDSGGGDELTLEEFFEDVQTLDNDLQTRSQELDAEGDALGEDPTVDDAIGILRRQVDLLDEFVDSIADLNAPSEAQAIQDEAVTAGRAVVDAFSDMLDGAEGSESLDDLFAAFDETTVEEAFARFDQVCLDAEQLAADNDITIDLNCEAD